MTPYDLKIAGGRVHDPVHGIDGQIVDLWIQAGKIVTPPQDASVRPTRIIDATGCVVMPGGIDIHCHIAGPKVNAARRLLPQEKLEEPPHPRSQFSHSGTNGSVPSTFATGYRYAALGYTTAFDAAVAPLLARHVHQEFADTPGIDTGFFAVVGDHHLLLDAIRAGDQKQVTARLGWLLHSTHAYAPKLVNPGGVETWKQNSPAKHGLDDLVDHFNVTPRQIISAIAAAGNELRLPHPLHLHCNELGMPGNWRTTLATMQALDGQRGHLTHIQFHSYGGGDADEGTFCSQTQTLADYFNQHQNLTVDVGQVMFGRTTSMTGDAAVGHYLSQLYGTRLFSHDIELEGGCGVAPIEYKQKNLVHALQWAIGLEWFLLVQDPWRVAMSTDHPNGGSFLAYPQIIRLLMDRAYRTEKLKELPPGIKKKCLLPELTREYSLQEICIITRSGPARILGLTNKGHLAPGADADMTIYQPNANYETMFTLPRYVIKSGQVMLDDAEPRLLSRGTTHSVRGSYDKTAEASIEKWFAQHSSVQYHNYIIRDEELAQLK
jgi:formylmethanofuran dehydrogenase subunit A